MVVSTIPSFLVYQWTGTELRGEYTFFVLVVRAGAFEAGRLTPDEILAVATASLTFHWAGGVSAARSAIRHTTAGGILLAQGAAASKAAAARSTAASWCRRPTIWRPTGNPLRVNPQGTEMAGRPVRVMP